MITPSCRKRKKISGECQNALTSPEAVKTQPEKVNASIKVNSGSLVLIVQRAFYFKINAITE